MRLMVQFPFFVQKLNSEIEKCQELEEWQINLIGEDDSEQDYTIYDWIPETITNKMKLLCINNSANFIEYKELYENTRLYDVIEYQSIKNAVTDVRNERMRKEYEKRK